MNAAAALSKVENQQQAYSPVAERATWATFLVADALAILTAYTLTILFRGTFAEDSLWPQYFRLAPFLLTIPILIALMDLYPGVLLNPVEEFRRITLAVSMGMALVVVATYLIREANVYSRLAFLIAAPLGIVMALAGRLWVRRLFCDVSWWGIPTVLVGPAKEVEETKSLLMAKPRIGIRPVAVLYSDIVTGRPQFKPRDGKTIPYALILIPSGADRNWVRSAERFVWGCNRIIIVPESTSLMWSEMRMRDCGGIAALEVRRELLQKSSRFVKRAIDLLLAIGGSVVILPGVLLVALLIKLSSSGPAFYGHWRIGERGKPFRAWKFRTMVENADKVLEVYLGSDPVLRAEWEETQKLRKDPRITGIGRILRETSLDELPQVYNVIRGEMSLVGPRPIVDGEVIRYGEEFELYQKVRPGITGLWQVSGRAETTYRQRVAMDVHYVRNWSIWLDFYLLAKTFGAVIRKQGAY